MMKSFKLKAKVLHLLYENTVIQLKYVGSMSTARKIDEMK